MTPINILSVDLDWIMEPSIEGYNFIANNNIDETWAAVKNLLPGLTFPEDFNKLNQLTKLLFDTKRKVDPAHFCIEDSHEQIVDHIKKWNINQPFAIYNIDHHHDCGYDNDRNTNSITGFFENIHCSNWVTSLRYTNTRFIDYNWICNKNSDMTLQDIAESYIPNFKKTIHINSLDNVKFDYIFICKSYCWVPPRTRKLLDSFIFALKQFYELNI